MKRSFAIVGLGGFGRAMLDALARRRLQTFVVDRDERAVQSVKDVATLAARADVLDRALFEEVFPERIDCAVVDLGKDLQATLLVVHHLKGLGVEEIVVPADSEAEGEILQVVGATRVVWPDDEAAERIAGLLLQPSALQYFSVSDHFSLIEMPMPSEWVGKTLAEMALTAKHKVLVVGVGTGAANENGDGCKWELARPERKLEAGWLVLLAGARKDLERFVADRKE